MLMGRLQTSSLRLRVLLLIAAAVLPWLGFAVDHAFSERQRDIEVSQRHMLHLTQILSSGQREVIAGAQGFLQVLAALPEVAEGVPATYSVFESASRHGIEVPIVAQVKAILDGTVAPADALISLLGREPKPERDAD